MTSFVTREETAGRHYQTICSLILLAMLVATCLLVDGLAQNRGLERVITAESRELAQKNGTLFSYTGNFIDFEERLFLDELPHADYANGGVYFFGTSNMKWAFQTWDLSADQQRSIGNYGIGASSHTTQLRLIRYLIDERGFLSSKKETLVVLGVSFHLASRETPQSYFFSLLRRQGLYRISADDRLEPTPLDATERWLKVEKARSGGFIWNLGRLANSWVATLKGGFHQPVHDPAKYRQSWREYMGPLWQLNMDLEVEKLRETISVLRAHHAQVEIMLLPQGTWMDELPFKSRYEAKIRNLCDETSTPLIDFSRAMSDNEFVDSNHLTVEGQEKFRNLIFGEIGTRAQKK